MSLEAKIDALTQALTALTEQVTTQNETLTNMRASGGKPAAAAGKEKPSAAAGKNKPAASKPRGRAPKKKTVEDVKKVYGEFWAAAEDKATKKRLVEACAPILEHFGVERISEIGEDDFDEAIRYGEALAAAFEEGGADAVEEVHLDFMDETGGDEDGDEGDDDPL